MKINKKALIRLIKEELQVVLTNEEVEEMFGEEVREELEQTEENFLRLPEKEPKAPPHNSKRNTRTPQEQAKYDRYIAAVDKEMKKEGTTPSMEVDTVDFSPRHPATIDTMKLAGIDLDGMTRHNGGLRVTLNKEDATKLRGYIKAHPAAFFESKKGQNTMKVKKSELIALIKEEIMAEMYDDPRMDVVYPEVREAQKIVEMIMDMSGGDKAAAMQMLMNAMGMLQGEMDVAAEPMMEETELKEALDNETMDVLAHVAQKLLPLLSVMSIPVLAGLVIEKVKEAADKSGAE